MSELTLEAAQSIVSTALEHARTKNFNPLAVIVLDARGSLRCGISEDGTSLMRWKVAFGKAWGAVAWGAGTKRLEKVAIDRPHFMAAVAHLAGIDQRRGDAVTLLSDHVVALEIDPNRPVIRLDTANGEAHHSAALHRVVAVLALIGAPGGRPLVRIVEVGAVDRVDRLIVRRRLHHLRIAPGLLAHVCQHVDPIVDVLE